MEAEALRPALRLFALNGPTDVDTDEQLDEQLAVHAREQYRESGIPEMATDAVVAAHLEVDEHLLCSRARAVVRRVEIDEESRAVVTAEGPLYVTNRRLLHFSDHIESIALLDIDELAMADDRILVTLVGSRGLTLDVDNPHQLRVLIAAAKAALRLHAEG